MYHDVEALTFPSLLPLFAAIQRLVLAEMEQ